MPIEEIDEKKRKRMLSNRESARRSRMKKQQHLGDLVNNVSYFKEENDRILNQVNLISVKCSKLDVENSDLRITEMELTERLKFLNRTLKQVEEKSGMVMDIPEIPETVMKPWPFACSVQPLLRTLKHVEEKSGLAMDIPEIPETLMKPWPFACSVQPLLRSAYMFQC